METYPKRSGDINPPVFTSALDGGEWSAWSSSRKACGSHWIGGWVSPVPVEALWKKEKCFVHAGFRTPRLLTWILKRPWTYDLNYHKISTWLYYNILTEGLGQRRRNFWSPLQKHHRPTNIKGKNKRIIYIYIHTIQIKLLRNMWAEIA
jgi:hypothetical protein